MKYLRDFRVRRKATWVFKNDFRNYARIHGHYTIGHDANWRDPINDCHLLGNSYYFFVEEVAIEELLANGVVFCDQRLPECSI